MSLLKRVPVPPLAPPDGLLGHLIVTDTRGDRVHATHTTLLSREDAEGELERWRHTIGGHRYAIAEVRLPGEVT